MTARRYESLPIWGPLASAMLALAWLIPNSTLPWVAFHKDFYVGVLFALIALAITLRAWRARRSFQADPLACVLALLAIVCLAQWAVGTLYFFGHAAVGATYLLAAASAILVGRAWEAEEPGAVARFLFTAFLLGAIGTAGLMLKQWLGVSGWEVYTYPLLDEPRPFGNMLQPNNAATLLLLGLVGVFWFRARALIGEAGFLVAGAFLVFALVLTQSRVGYLGFVVLAGLGLLVGPRQFGPWVRRAIVLLAVFFAVALVLLPMLNGWLGQEVTLVTRSKGELRWKVWGAFFAVALQHPLTGLGFLPGIAPQMAAAEIGHPLPGYFAWMHDAFLDIAVWFGIPAVLALIAACLLLVQRFWTAPRNQDVTLYAAALVALGLHGLVELPLAYAYFLLPCALLLGALAEHVRCPALRIDARALTAVVVLLTGSLAVIAHDYLEVESSIYSWRFKLQNVGLRHDMDLPETLLLTQFRAYMTGVRLPEQALDDETLQDFEHAVEHQPSPISIQALVMALAQRGHFERARYWVSVAREICSPEQRKALSASWQSRVAQDRKYALVQWPE